MGEIALTIGTGELSPQEAVALVRRAEELGYHSVWLGETWGRESFTQLTWLAAHTHTIKLGTGIVNVWSRSPALIAQTAATLDELSGGRLILGLGSSGPIVIENWHGIPYRKPLQRTREYVEIIRLALAGERVNYQGEFFHLSRFRLDMKPLRREIPIYIAALGPENIRLAGELADGWIPIWFWADRLEEMRGYLAAGAQARGRRPEDITIAPYVLTCVADGDLEEVRRLARAHVAYYVGGMGDYYNNLVRRYGFQREARAIKEAWSRGDRQEAASQVSDELLRAVTNIGSAQECRQRLADYQARGVGLNILYFPHGASKEMLWRTVEALAPKPGAGR